MRSGQNLYLVFLIITILTLLGISYYSYTSSWFREEKKESNTDLIFPSRKEKKQGNTDLIFPVGIACAQPSVSNSRPDVSTMTPWLAPIVWEGTYDLTVIDNIYKQQNITVALTVFALGKYVRFLKDFLESAEEHFMVGYRVSKNRTMNYRKTSARVSTLHLQ